MQRRKWTGAPFALLLLITAPTFGQEAAIRRILPPEGIEVPPARKTALEQRLGELQLETARLQDSPLIADVEIYLKAVRYALENGEFFHPREIGWAEELLDSAADRLKALQQGQTPWTKQSGLVVRGYRSELDGSVQPYGLEIPEDLDLSKPVRLYVWLHGRANNTVDLQFLHQRQNRPGRVQPGDGIILHPFGRYCNAFKLAGEIDVFEAIDATASNYPIDRDRIVLWGFSMGGAGVWHLAAHYPDRWVAASPGAGFAETARYQRLTPARYPVWYEQTLWNVYDAPNYVRNLFNLPVVAYSGERDRQIQAARVMEEAYEEHGEKLTHLIGPDTEHRYHPETQKQLTETLSEYATKGRDPRPQSVSFQTRTLRYNRCFWVTVLGMEEHWKDCRVDAEVDGETVKVTTVNVISLELASPFEGPFPQEAAINIDGQTVSLSGSPQSVVLSQKDGKWKTGELPADGLRKSPGLQGPIDDAFMEPFLVVAPVGEGWNPQFDAWAQAELDHFRDRWRRLFRGELREKRADAVTAEELQTFNVILWGDPQSNPLIAQALEGLPVSWTQETLTVGETTAASSSHAPVMIYPNPLAAGKRYVVINSGFTFREAHDRTNSLQNPKLPDWAIIDLSQPRTGTAPGGILDAGFFDEHWRFKPAPTE